MSASLYEHPTSSANAFKREDLKSPFPMIGKGANEMNNSWCSRSFFSSDPLYTERKNLFPVLYQKRMRTKGDSFVKSQKDCFFQRFKVLDFKYLLKQDKNNNIALKT
jgi:hypothetical protein